jgi:ElaB/YqjD/DUF883 family membrane-anchored ribosome-binding protein
MWNPVTGFARSWKAVAIVAGVALLIGVIAAKNTR